LDIFIGSVLDTCSSQAVVSSWHAASLTSNPDTDTPTNWSRRSAFTVCDDLEWTDWLASDDEVVAILLGDGRFPAVIGVDSHFFDLE
jgi:hypothetical protein